MLAMTSGAVGRHRQSGKDCPAVRLAVTAMCVVLRDFASYGLVGWPLLLCGFIVVLFGIAVTNWDQLLRADVFCLRC